VASGGVRYCGRRRDTGSARRKLELAATWYREAVELPRDNRARQLLERAKRVIDQLQGCNDLKDHVAVLRDAVIAINLRRSGRRNPPRQMLYDSVFEVWTEDFKQPRQFSRSNDGTPTGPCVRYLTAALGPVLGDRMLSLEGIREIIERF
jgi:hypothetical protein